MPRSARHLTVRPGFPHHVILRGNNRRRLFSFGPCYRAFLALLASASRRHTVPVHSLTLMSNHVHLVLTPRDAPTLASFVRAAAQPYALRRNATRHGTGKLFEQRYVALAIDDIAYLATTIAYVDSNPVRAGLVSDAAAYRWSTAAAHLGGEVHAAVRAVWTPHDWYLSLGSDDARRAARYREWLASRDAGELDAIAEAADDRHDVAPPRSGTPIRPDGSSAV